MARMCLSSLRVGLTSHTGVNDGQPLARAMHDARFPCCPATARRPRALLRLANPCDGVAACASWGVVSVVIRLERRSTPTHEFPTPTSDGATAEVGSVRQKGREQWTDPCRTHAPTRFETSGFDVHSASESVTCSAPYQSIFFRGSRNGGTGALPFLWICEERQRIS